ncbi:granulocyte-macrophage colony-stimulating factor receptor subunit alpha-like isoform X3 [Meles meles]|uniref:granulocyte-macrophage colony-stimulating factor receptor subunit alpha-like isoform X3 n=1 Tax=Meles meles TaxID=9662 RepID=UPI001E699E11|nr:granulocyte-macrophage colony-stimulating factor receptor subunit alpha-like isoform X3 [Meles meles]XP_045852638.1 granulocyte-macrophage colony-stimulating factor receptor subunit alpha-like isoform X3 [Meles meles]
MSERRETEKENRWPEQSPVRWGFPHPLGNPVRLLAITILFFMLLDPVFLQTLEQQDLPTAERVPRLNMRFDSWRMKLSWDCEENTTYLECVMIHKENGPINIIPREKECHCEFSDYSLHDGVKLMVKVNSTQRPIPETLVYANSGGNGTAAQNFSCFIYNANFMNCSWTKGRAAPDDVQYFLYIRDSKKRREIECPHYIEDWRTHVGCHLEDLSGLTSYNYFLVNGTSQRTGIQFFDSVLSWKKIEIYSPPNNISVLCNESHCLIHWEKPKTRFKLSNMEFKYQLDIQRKSNKENSENQPIEVPGNWENSYNFPSPEPRPKHTVKIRTSDARIQKWGAWSQPIEFGSEETAPSLVPIYALVVLGTLITVLTLGCLLKRFLASQTLFPPIPRIKDKWTDSHRPDHKVIWENFTLDTEKGDNEEILTVQEVTVAPASMGTA